MRLFWSFWIFSCLHFPAADAKSLSYSDNDTMMLFRGYEDTLKTLQYDKISEHSTDKEKLDANRHFLHVLRSALELPGSIHYPFDSLTTIGRITSPDNQFRIITWDIAKNDGTFLYYGFIQSYNHAAHRYILYELNDKSAEITDPHDAVYTPDKWFGMLYYKVVPERYAGKTIYMMLAWQGYSSIITRKIIDVLSFNDKGEPSFGMAVFKKPPPGSRGNFRRIIFQYSANAFMSLTYNSKKNIIVFDHLAPMEAQLVGQYQYYAPSFIVDCLAYKGSGWQYMADIDARNPSNSEDKDYIDPSKHAPDMNKKEHDFDAHSLYNPDK